GLISMVVAACVLNFQRAVRLLVISLVTIFFLVWNWIMERYGDCMWEALSPTRDLLSKNWFWIRCFVMFTSLVAVVCWLVLDTAQLGTRQLVSYCGLLLLIFIMLLFSKHPFRWPWHTLICGVGLQFVFGLLILRTTFGLSAVRWLGKQAETFQSFADAGSQFVFGDSYTDHFFAFRVMPIVVFLSSVISWLICKIGFVVQVIMGTSPAESMAAAGNIFLENTDAALLIRPYISELTVSEIHAVMTGGFASISGSILGAFISLGVDATHLLTATLMSAPASLAIAKIFWPEKEKTVSISNRDLKLIKGENENRMRTASQGVARAVGVVANIISNIIAFLALLAFFDAVLSWLGGMFDCPQLSFSVTKSRLFASYIFMMGVSWEDSFIVAELIGKKTFLNEFVVYQKLSEFIQRRTAGGPGYVDGVKQYISVHSEAVVTYSLCGFSNIAWECLLERSVTVMAPNRQSDISRCVLRALTAGSMACFITACIAGMLFIPDCQHFLSSNNNTNLTNSSKQLLDCCSQLYNSVMVHKPWNVTVGGGFTESSLWGCCALTPPQRFNCS
uniref:Solute carrier family 28 member 3 n=1 Tax=Poecilia formosa TaxID=48698 RepID=A0A087YLL9_POEFO